MNSRHPTRRFNHHTLDQREPSARAVVASLRTNCVSYNRAMITLTQALDGLRRLAPELAARHVARIGVFGSLARGEAKPGSDIDILVELTADGDLFDLVAVKNLLEQSFGSPVDVVPVGGLKPDVRETILREVRYAA